MKRKATLGFTNGNIKLKGNIPIEILIEFFSSVIENEPDILNDVYNQINDFNLSDEDVLDSYKWDLVFEEDDLGGALNFAKPINMKKEFIAFLAVIAIIISELNEQAKELEHDQS